ncbi:MAG: hypothetical protein PHG02_04835 [Oscillospiraceae bacterium]|nr:hypothetical protein [Oscillospiraceae bacterium]
MNCIFIRGACLPSRVRGVTVKDCDDDYNVYINQRLSPDTQRKAAQHEIRHIRMDHFYDEEPVIVNEIEAN